jgi:hypothetical protein
MPLFMATPNKVNGLTPDGVSGAHTMDPATEEKHGVKYLRYWFNEKTGRIYCLVEAPSAEAAEAVHREAHGLLPDEIVQLTEGH